MTRTKRQFGRRGPPVVTHRPEGLPETKPADPKRKRSLAISLFSAGALAAAATHFLERGSAEECVPVAVPATGPTALPRISTTGAPLAAPTTVPPAPSAVASDGCPPGTVRSTTHSSTRRHTFSSWHWSSSRSSGSSFFGRSSSTSPASSSTTRRGGFGSIGSFHFSGGS
jgi:hypothetical protein